MRATSLRRLLGAIWADDRARRRLVLSQLALLVMVAFDLLIPQAIRSIVNDGILGDDIYAVLRGAFYMAIFAVASMVFATINAWTATTPCWPAAGRTSARASAS